MHTHASSALDNHVTLTFDLLTSGSMHAKPLPCSLCLPSSVLIAQAVFLSEHGHRYTHTVPPQTHIHFLALWTLSRIIRVSRYQNESGFYWSKRQWVAVTSARPYANLHLAPDRDNHANIPALCFYRPDALPAAKPTTSKHWRQHIVPHTDTKSQTPLIILPKHRLLSAWVVTVYVLGPSYRPWFWLYLVSQEASSGPSATAEHSNGYQRQW